MNNDTLSKMAALIAEAKEKQLKANNIKVVTIPAPQDEDNTANNIKLLSDHIQNDMTAEEKQTQILTLKEFKIIWHEGRHIEGATFENTTFTSWAEIQKAFFILWDTNERGQDGGYTKVKVCISFNEIEATHTTRVDITNKIGNGDFNPTQEHIFNYLKNDLDGVNEGKTYSFEAFESLEMYDPAKDIIKAALNNIEPIQATSIEDLEIKEQGREDSIYNVELSTVTIADLLGEDTEASGLTTEQINSFKEVREAEQGEENEIKVIFETPLLIVYDYSEKSFSIGAKVGNTKPYKEIFEKLGGSFNPRLKKGNFIFSKKHLQKVASEIVLIK